LVGIQQLPTLPIVYLNLQKAMTKSSVSAREISSIVEQDQSLTTKLLRVVNSAYYGFPGRISTLGRTIVLLGFNEVKHVALSISVMKAFQGVNADNGFDIAQFWRHAIGVAVCSGIFAKRIGPSLCASHEEAFVAGLLHDIGKIVEDQFIHDKFSEVVKSSKDEKISIHEAELRVFGFSHEMTGEFLASTWNLPKELCAVCGFHHTPLAKKSEKMLFPIISVVHFADIFATVLGLGNGGDPFVMLPVKDCWNTLGIGIEDLEPIAEECIATYDDMIQCLMSD
jgi:HD-like signal output (HDOD) protein